MPEPWNPGTRNPGTMLIPSIDLQNGRIVQLVQGEQARHRDRRRRRVDRAVQALPQGAADRPRRGDVARQQRRAGAPHRRRAPVPRRRRRAHRRPRRGAAGRWSAGGDRRVGPVPRPRSVDRRRCCRRSRGGDQPRLRRRAAGDRRRRARHRRRGRQGGPRGHPRLEDIAAIVARGRGAGAGGATATSSSTRTWTKRG